MQAKMVLAGGGTQERRSNITKAVESNGGSIVEADEANCLMWLDPSGQGNLGEILDANSGIGWVQLPWAGVEWFNDPYLLDRPVAYTCAKGAYATSTSEHALMLMFATLRNLTAQARSKSWLELDNLMLREKRVTILGGGGMATETARLLKEFGCDITILRRSEAPVEYANKTLTISSLHDVLPSTDILLLALALTPATTNIVGEQELALLPNSAIVINMARGRHVDTDALVKALQTQSIAAAGLDVTEPEPLPDGHPLWEMDNVLITSHCADSHDYINEELPKRVGENVRRFATQEPMLGVVDKEAGY